VSIAKWNLKEAGGKVPSRRTETVYEALQGGRVFAPKRSPKVRRGREQISDILPEPCNVDTAATWDEGYQALTRGGLDDMQNSNPYSDVWLNVQKSAEVIVP